MVGFVVLKDISCISSRRVSRHAGIDATSGPEDLKPLQGHSQASRLCTVKLDENHASRVSVIETVQGHPWVKAKVDQVKSMPSCRVCVGTKVAMRAKNRKPIVLTSVPIAHNRILIRE